MKALRASNKDPRKGWKVNRTAPDGHKWCPRCQQFLPLGDFNPNSGAKATPHGRATYCSLCQSNYSYGQRLKRVFGITLDQYDHLLEAQDYRCFICRTEPKKMRLAVDHNHHTGEIRGLLCKRCNQSLLGAGGHDPEVLRRAADYLDNPPARVVLNG